MEKPIDNALKASIVGIYLHAIYNYIQVAWICKSIPSILK